MYVYPLDQCEALTNKDSASVEAVDNDGDRRLMNSSTMAIATGSSGDVR